MMISNKMMKSSEEPCWLTSLDIKRQKELLSRHAAFWHRRAGSEALIGYAPMSRMFPLRNLRIQHEGPFTADNISDEVLFADTQYRPAYLLGDDLFPAKMPLEPLAWSEGYTGANVYLSSQAQTVWTKPNEQVPETLEELKSGLNPLWRDKLTEATRKNVDAAAGEFLISETLLRGPADCLEAILGAERLCLWMYDYPALVESMIDWLTDCVIQLYQCQYEVLPVFHGGSINRYRIWGRGRNIVTQADIANIMSPDHFRKIFIPAYRNIARAFDTATLHFHSSAVQHLDALLEIEELAAIEWALDPTGPALEDMMEPFQRIQKRGKAVIVMNLKTGREIQLLLEHLQPEGLCLIVRKDY